MALSWKNIAVARTNCGADVLGLAGFLRDDDLICHYGPLGKDGFNDVPLLEHIMNKVEVQALGGHGSIAPQCLLYPNELTSSTRAATSEKCQRTKPLAR